MCMAIYWCVHTIFHFHLNYNVSTAPIFEFILFADKCNVLAARSQKWNKQNAEFNVMQQFSVRFISSLFFVAFRLLTLSLSSFYEATGFSFVQQTCAAI